MARSSPQLRLRIGEKNPSLACRVHIPLSRSPPVTWRSSFHTVTFCQLGFISGYRQDFKLKKRIAGVRSMKVSTILWIASALATPVGINMTWDPHMRPGGMMNTVLGRVKCCLTLRFRAAVKTQHCQFNDGELNELTWFPTPSFLFLLSLIEIWTMENQTVETGSRGGHSGTQSVLGGHRSTGGQRR